ncbi:hypothetical protein HPB48_001249 [Haemaphysalis longicornis]|uniref:Uncharacterized protein n=1 Tax=Haemaphysalis longicornis TaxID=44386 RepID=A0A9J6F8V6_HAELO|nr:hypothetical protein HPB48_001249 [Haemaphysalis longicornis]
MDAPATGTRPPNGKSRHVGHRHTPDAESELKRSPERTAKRTRPRRPRPKCDSSALDSAFSMRRPLEPLRTRGASCAAPPSTAPAVCPSASDARRTSQEVAQPSDGGIRGTLQTMAKT